MQSRAHADWLTDSRWVVPALFAVALGLRLALMLLLPQQPFSDGDFYFRTAIEIASGRGYNDDGVPTAFWPIGYPALLAGSMELLGTSSLIGPLLLNLAAAAAILALILWFGRHIAGSEAAARFGALLYALYPAHVAYTGTVLSETTYTAVTMAATALLIARRHCWRGLAIAGLLFGLATLMRPQTMLFPAGVMIVLLLAYRDFRWAHAARAAVILHIALAVVVSPWTIRNQQVLGEPVLVSTNGGVALYAGAHDGATGGHFASAWEHGPVWNATGIPFEERIERQLELDHRFKALALNWIGEHPDRYAALGFKKVALIWAKDSDGFWGLKNSHPRLEAPLTAAQWVNQAYYMLLLGLAAVCFVAAARALLLRDERMSPLALLACMPLFVTLLAFVFTGQTRYHYPAMPFIAIAAGWTLSRLVVRPRAAARFDAAQQAASAA